MTHKAVDPSTKQKMRGGNINCCRDPLLFFPYISLPKELRKGLAPQAALLEIFRTIEHEKLYANKRWTHVKTFGNRRDEDKVAQLFQMVSTIQIAVGGGG